MKDKQAVLENLRKTPIIQVACEKAGVGRASYYRWKKEDTGFSKMADESIEEGVRLISELAESQLISSIKNQNMTGIIFWLKNHHPAYTPKLELTAPKSEELSEDQKTVIKRALKLTGISDMEKGGKNDISN